MSGYWGPFTQAPNLLILVTDQQRTAQHLPADWVQKHLPNLWALVQGGVTFPNAMTNTTACSPARATLWTSTFPTINGVIRVGGTLNMSITTPTSQSLTTLGLALAKYAPAGITYQIAYKGKWHLDGGFETLKSLEQQQGTTERAAQRANDQVMESTYGFPGWTSQDFGTTMSPDTTGWQQWPPQPPPPTSPKPYYIYDLGGGFGENDKRVATDVSYVTPDKTNPDGTVEGARKWLAARANNDSNNPFCLVVSLLNPHDVFVSPVNYISAGYPPITSGPNQGKYPWQVHPFTEITALPDSYDLSTDVLTNKPSMQINMRWAPASGSAQEAQRRAAALDYLRFYAYLQKLSDDLLEKVTSAMTSAMVANTLIVRLADHGEMAMSQGGMIEKEYQAYNETLLVPMVFSNPGLPQGVACTGLAGLIDVLPTLAEVCGLTIPSDVMVQGTSLAPAILAGASGSTYTQFQFASNDGVLIRALIDTDKHNAKYVVSGSIQGTDWQCELYDFCYDPGAKVPRAPEITNQIPVNGLQPPGSYASTQAIQARWHDMHVALTCAMKDAITTPANWPAAPPAKIPS